MLLPLLKKPTDIIAKIRLETERLIIRPPQDSDRKQWLNTRTKNRVFLEPWEPKWVKRPLQDKDFNSFLQRRRRYWQNDQGYCFLLFNKENNSLIGNVNINNVIRGISQFASLGYWVAEEHNGKSYMTEALTSIINHAFIDLKLHKITASCMPHNATSIRVLEKLNFSQEGYVKKHLKIAGKWEDHLLFGILQDNTVNTIQNRNNYDRIVRQ